MTERVNQLKTELLDAGDEVSNAIEAGEDRRQLAAGHTVEQLARRYAELIEELPPAERQSVEATLGRKVVDLRRAAEQLTKRASGAKVARAVDAGFVPFLEQRTPGRSMEPSRHAPGRHAPQFSVGRDAEAWCGKCQGMRTHHIVALVGGEPKQVICQSCKSRHAYRAGPTIREAAARPAAVPVARHTTAEQRDEARRLEIRRALIKELDAVDEPRRFDPKGRYKAGEIILHPEHGKGKIENVLKGSLLVRFREGLRPLNLG